MKATVLAERYDFSVFFFTPVSIPQLFLGLSQLDAAILSPYLFI